MSRRRSILHILAFLASVVLLVSPVVPSSAMQVSPPPVVATYAKAKPIVKMWPKSYTVAQNGHRVRVNAVRVRFNNRDMSMAVGYEANLILFKKNPRANQSPVKAWLVLSKEVAAHKWTKARTFFKIKGHKLYPGKGAKLYGANGKRIKSVRVYRSTPTELQINALDAKLAWSNGIFPLGYLDLTLKKLGLMS